MPDQDGALLAFAELFENLVSTHRHRVFVTDAVSGQVLTYDGLKDAVVTLRHKLRNAVVPGDPVAVRVRNSVDFYVVCVALMCDGHALFLLAPDWPIASVSSHLRAIGARLLITSSDMIKGLDTGVGIPLGDLSGYRLNQSETTTNAIPARAYLATSGSTGLNKWVPKGIEEISANLSSWATRLELSADDRIHSMLPLCTANGFYITFLLPLLCGASVVLDQRFSGATLSGIYRHILKYKSTVVSIVPTIIYMSNVMLEDEMAQEFKMNSSVRFAICGTAPLDVVEKQRFADRMDIPVCFNYGITETLFISSQCLADWKANDTGTLLDSMNVTISSDGEIDVRAGARFEPYYGLEEGGFRADGSFVTGDTGYFEGERLMITGRKKDIVIVGGFNVHPAEVDYFIIRESFVIETYTFGLPNPILGEELVSTVMINGTVDTSSAKKQINRALKNNLPPHKLPRVEVVSQIIKTPNGKPVKAAMIEEVQRRSGAKQFKEV